MRTTYLAGLAAIALVAGVGPSQARFKLRLTHHTGPVRVAPAITVPVFSAHAPNTTLPRGVISRTAAAAVAAPLAVRTAEALAPGEVGEITIPAPPAPVAPMRKREDAGWCPSGQVAGSGAGFCLIN